jgi:Rrf2 family iron-sulfur cluster assembly transcriptional regulator
MKLTTKARYAVMAMVDIAGQSCENPVTLAEVADRQDISLAYLEQLFCKLRRADIVRSVRGPGGGYCLCRAAHKISVCDIIMAVEEPIKAVRCERGNGAGCVKGLKCQTHDLWAALDSHIHNYLASITLAEILNGDLPSPCQNTGDIFQPVINDENARTLN